MSSSATGVEPATVVDISRAKRPAWVNGIVWAISQSYAAAILAVIVLSIVMMIDSPYFATYANLTLVARSASFVAIASLGQLPVVILRGIDVSVGSIMGAAGVVMAQLSTASGVSPAVAILGGLAAGLVVGAVNALLVSYGRMPPFMVTLGMLYVVRGLTIVHTNATPIFGVPGSIKRLGEGSWLGIPSPVVILLVLAAVWAVILHLTPWGRHIYAIGGNEAAAHLAGVAVRRVKFAAYVMCGLFAAAAGILLTSHLGVADPTAATGYELNIIAAVVIGGASFSGGSGTVWGLLWGAFLLALVVDAMGLAGISAFWSQVVIGSVVLGAVIIDRLRRLSGVS